MTDVVTHADPSLGDQRRRARGRRAHRGLRVPGATSAALGHGPSDLLREASSAPDDAAPARHRRAPGTAPVAVPRAGTTGNRHHADGRTAVDPVTGRRPAAHAAGPAEPRTVETHTGGHRAVEPRTGSHRTVEPRTGSHRTVEPRTGSHRTAEPRTGSHRAAEPPTAEPAPPGPAHAAPRPARRSLPLRATIGLIGGGGVAALFALTSPGGSTTPAAPLEPLPSAAPAGLFSPAPSAPPALPLVPVAPPVAPPAVSTTPTTEEPQPVIGALFDAAAGSLADLFDNSGNSGLVENASRPRVVANPDDPGREAWQFTLGGGGKRSEVLPRGRGTEPVDGDEQYVRYTARLSDDFPTDTGSWQVILQWHQSAPDGSPPLALQVTRGQLMMVSGGDDMQPIGPVSPGDRIDLTMHIKFSQDPSQSAVTVWRDGRPTGVTDWSPRQGTMSTHSAYLKMGMYRDPNIRQAGSVLVTDLKIGRDPRGIGGLGPRAVD